MATKKAFTDESLETFVGEIKSYTDAAVSTKADDGHSHAISDVTNLQTTLDNKSNTGHTHASDTISSVYEANLTWGGKSIMGGVTPVDAAASSLHSANRFAFAKPAGIIIEYSNDGGATWIDYEASDTDKIKMVSGLDVYFYLGKRISGGTTADDKLRISLKGTTMQTYALLRKLLISISTNGTSGFNVSIEKANQGSEDTFTNLGTFNLTGWSAWNSIPASYGAFGGGVNQTSNTAVIRLTFGITGISETSDNRAHVRNIIAIGDNSWTYPSQLARTGHIYNYDVSQNAMFPANVSATTFIGALSGNATSATSATKATQDASGNVITDTYATKTELDTSKEDLQTAINDKADASHSHAISDVADLQTTLDTKVPITRTINGKSLSEDITLVASDIGADTSGSASEALESAKEYADTLASNKADSSHTHDDLYYTQTKIDELIAQKSQVQFITWEDDD